MEQNSPRHFDGDEIKIMKEVVEKGGPEAVSKHIDCLDLVKLDPVEIAVIGRVGTGKATFINAIRNVEKGATYAEPRDEPAKYDHPQNKNIVLWDIPSTNSLKGSPKKHISEEAIQKYDFFLIFVLPSLARGDISLAEKLIKQKKPFCFIRSRIDEAIRNGEREEKSPESVKDQIRDKINEELKGHTGALQPNKTHVFIIASTEKEKHDMPKLVSYMEEKISLIKVESVLDRLCAKLRSDIAKKTAVCAFVSGLPLPVTDVLLNIDLLLREIEYYIKVLGMSNENITSLRKSVQHNLRFQSSSTLVGEVTPLIIGNIGKAIMYGQVLSTNDHLGLFPPFVGSIVSALITAAIVYNRLSTILDDLRHDAILIFKHLSKDKRTSLGSAHTYSFP